MCFYVWFPKRQRCILSNSSCSWYIIRIHHECEGGIEKSVPRITDWHCEACRVMAIDDRKGRIFFYPTLTWIMVSFSCSPLNTLFYIGKHEKKTPENHEYAEMRLRSTCSQHAANVHLFIFFHGLVWVCEIDPDLVCENQLSQIIVSSAYSNIIT